MLCDRSACCCLHINYIVYKHFDRSLHVGSTNPTCVPNFRPVPLMVFEIQGFKLKNKNNDNNKKNWRNRLFVISRMFVVQLSPNVRCRYILTLAIILQCQKWIITESESVNPNFRMYRHNGPRPRPTKLCPSTNPITSMFTTELHVCKQQHTPTGN